MPTKILNGKMWKIQKVYDDSINVPLVLFSSMIETENANEAMTIMLWTEKRRCPFCGGRACFHPSLMPSDPFKEENIDYVLCLCIKTEQKFILQRRFGQRENLNKCLLCGSPHIEVKGRINIDDYVEVTCKQCAQNYVLCESKNS